MARSKSRNRRRVLPPEKPSEIFTTDRVTFLEIDRARPLDDVFSATDPRAAPAIGGVKIGSECLLLDADDMPHITAEMVARACDNIVRGQESYSSLLYLSRARPEDTETLYAASQSPEIRVRWERLWVLSTYFARMSRHEVGAKALIQCMQDDLASVHLLSKFVDQNNPAIKRMFTRIHDPLLEMLIGRLMQCKDDPRRSSLLIGILSAIERDPDVLQPIIEKQAKNPAITQQIMSLLVIRKRMYGKHSLSSAVIKNKLEGWRRGY